MTEFEEIWNKMLNGEEYDATHSGLRDLLQKTRLKVWEFNNLRPDQIDEMNHRFSTEIIYSILYETQVLI